MTSTLFNYASFIFKGLGFSSGLGPHGINLNAGAGLGQQYTNYDHNFI
jgi:hypothetical protein